MSEIHWPSAFLPGTTDFYVANETTVAGLTAADAWLCLSDTQRWPESYAALDNIHFHDGSGPALSLGARFDFTVGGTLVQAEVTEHVAPTETSAGRLAWHGWVENDGQVIVDAHCAWLIENLSQHRVRVVWHESLLGPVPQELARAPSNPVVAAHQDWVDGIVKAARAAKAS